MAPAELDELNALYIEAVRSDQLLAQVLRAIVWDVALLVGSLAIAEHPDVLRWKFQATGPTNYGYQSPVLTGHRGVVSPARYFVPLFATFEKNMWTWIGEHTQQIELTRARAVQNSTAFSRAFTQCVNGAITPYTAPLGRAD